jgi:hypothetical protein
MRSKASGKETIRETLPFPPLALGIIADTNVELGKIACLILAIRYYLAPLNTVDFINSSFPYDSFSLVVAWTTVMIVRLPGYNALGQFDLFTFKYFGYCVPSINMNNVNVNYFSISII